MEIKIKKLNDMARLPERGSDYAAGYDLYSAERVEIPAGQSVFVHTGIAIEIPEGYFGAIYARSGLACKQGLRPANCVGIIDSDYRGEVAVVLRNDCESVKAELKHITPRTSAVELGPNHEDDRIVEQGDRIAQLIIQKFEEVNFVEVNELDDTDRGEGGFGSTGTN